MKISKIISKKFLALFAIAVTGAAGFFVLGNKTSAAFFGAIYTSTFDGMSTNQNLYPNREAVYLNGGPQNQNANGLPDGTYYFQVTNPSGSVLLSTDMAVCRQLLVSGGKVAGATGPCPHPIGIPNSANGSTPVQLFPFNETPNNGGEYKVWLIRQASNTTVAMDGIHINFSNSNAKTDNFKVEREVCTDCEPTTVTLSGHKFYDANANALDDDGQAVEGVKIKITLTIEGEVQEPVYVFTDANGDWSYGNIPSGAEYVVEEILPETCEPGTYWVQTAPVADSEGNQRYSGTADVDIDDLDFGDICFHPGSGGLTLGFWSNKNGERTMGSLMGVDFNIYPTAADNPAFPEAGTALQRDLNFLSRLNLKGEAENKKVVSTINFDPSGSNHNAFRSWILNANAYNMSYMLSGQLAATSLNVRHTSLFDNTIVDARGVCNSVGSCLGFITIGEVRRMANMSLGAAGGNTTISGDPHRNSQELMKNFLDDVNNNRLSFGSASPCGVCYPPEETTEP